MMAEGFLDRKNRIFWRKEWEGKQTFLYSHHAITLRNCVGLGAPVSLTLIILSTLRMHHPSPYNDLTLPIWEFRTALRIGNPRQ